MGRKKKGDLSAKKIRASFTINPDYVEAITEIARQQNRKVSSIFEEIIKKYLLSEGKSAIPEAEAEAEAKAKTKTELKKEIYIEPTTTHQV